MIIFHVCWIVGIYNDIIKLYNILIFISCVVCIYYFDVRERFYLYIQNCLNVISYNLIVQLYSNVSPPFPKYLVWLAYSYYSSKQISKTEV